MSGQAAAKAPGSIVSSPLLLLVTLQVLVLSAGVLKSEFIILSVSTRSRGLMSDQFECMAGTDGIY